MGARRTKSGGRDIAVLFLVILLTDFVQQIRLVPTVLVLRPISQTVATRARKIEYWLVAENVQSFLEIMIQFVGMRRGDAGMEIAILERRVLVARVIVDPVYRHQTH